MIIKWISRIFLVQLILIVSFWTCKEKSNETNSKVIDVSKNKDHCDILKNVAHVYEGTRLTILLCLKGKASNLEIKVNGGGSDFLHIIDATCNGLNCSIEAEYQTAASATLKMKIYGNEIQNGYVDIEIDGKKQKFELID
ncbi:hypothetical protein AB3N59_02520 [Leptospira sp. WS92.C1]